MFFQCVDFLPILVAMLLVSLMFLVFQINSIWWFRPYWHFASLICINIAGCQVSYFFLFSEKFLFFPIFHRNSYFFLFFSSFFSTFILFFSQKLKEASKIRRISYSGKSHSCEIASLWSFPPK